MTTALCERTVVELASAIQSGAVSPVDVVDAYLERIDERNERTNSFVTVCDESARRAAREAERAVERGESLGPLHGIPIGVKDLIDVAGVRTTYGSPSFADHVPETDATVVSRLRDAGAIVLGKTNTPEFGRKTVTDNPIFGTTKNPWNTEKTPGGSSGGSAAAVADRLVPIALGTDAAGSSRIPAAACGTIGFIPSFGRIPHGPARADAFNTYQPYTYVGLLARSPADVALVLDTVAGPDPADPFSLPGRPDSYRDVIEDAPDLSSLTIGYSPVLDCMPVSVAVGGVVDDAVNELSAAGATVESADPPFDHTWDEMHEAIEIILQARYVGLYDGFLDDGVDLLDQSRAVTPEVTSRIRTGLDRSVREYKRAERIRTAMYDAINEAVNSMDVLVTPTLSIPAFDLGDESPTVEGESVHPMHGWTLTWPFNLTGNPATSIPIGTVDGLPVGLQIIGSRLDDGGVLAAAAAITDRLPFDDSPIAIE